jgi:hypothetical protein
MFGPSLAVSAKSHHFALDENTWTFNAWNASCLKDTLNFTVSANQSWISVSPASGTSTGSADKQEITVTVSRGEKSLPNTGVITIASNGGTKMISIIVAPDYFTEYFNSNPPLGNTTLTFTPNDSANYYCATTNEASDFPTDPAGGTVLNLDEGNPLAVVPASPISFYGVDYAKLFVDGHGYVTFGNAPQPSIMSESLDDHFSSPRISALLPVNGVDAGMVSVKQDADKVAVTFEGVPSMTDDSEDMNDFQIEMFFDGTIRLTYLEVNVPEAVVGLSFGPTAPGGGVPSDYEDSDLTGYNTNCLSVSK